MCSIKYVKDFRATFYVAEQYIVIILHQSHKLYKKVVNQESGVRPGFQGLRMVQYNIYSNIILCNIKYYFHLLNQALLLTKICRFASFCSSCPIVSGIDNKSEKDLNNVNVVIFLAMEWNINQSWSCLKAVEIESQFITPQVRLH